MTKTRPQIWATLRLRIQSYYEANPSEELTYKLIISKFECTKRQAREIVGQLRDEGVLEALHVIRRREQGIAKEVA